MQILAFLFMTPNPTIFKKSEVMTKNNEVMICLNTINNLRTILEEKTNVLTIITADTPMDGMTKQEYTPEQLQSIYESHMKGIPEILNQVEQIGTLLKKLAKK